MKKLCSMLLVLAVLVSCIGTAFVTEATAATVNTDEMMIADWLFGETVYYRGADTLMSEYADAGITDVFLLVKGTAGRLAWQSSVSGTTMSYSDRDILEETCTAAKKYGIRVHAWMAAGQDSTFASANSDAIAYHFRVGTGSDVTQFMDFRNSDYQAYMRSLIKELNTYDIAGIHFDYIRYGTLFYDWGAGARNALINDYGITKAEYNAAVKAMCVTANSEYSASYKYTENSDGYYVYSSSGTTPSGVTFSNALAGQGSTDALNGTTKVAAMRKDLLKNFIAEVTADLDSDKMVSCAIMPESVTDYGAQAAYCQDPEVLKDVVDFVAIMSYANQYGGANTWPATLAKACAADGCNAIAAIQTFDCENSNADPTCTDIYNEFYNVVSARETVNADSSYTGKILGCAFFRAAKMTLASAYVKDSTTMNFKVHQQDELETALTKLVFTMKNGVKISSISNKDGWGSSTFTISSDKTTLTITNSSGILGSYGSASFDVTYTGTVSETTGACMLQCYNSSGEDYAFCSTLYPKHEHSYTSKVTTESTCTTAGVKTYTCSCGDTYTEALPLIEHNYSSVVTTDPTCSAVGVLLYRCSGCSSSYTEDIAKIAHSYSSSYNEETGLTTYTCDNCGNSFESNCGLTHERVETWATAEKDHMAFCYNCNISVIYSCYFIESERIAPTCTTEGSVTYICGGHYDTHTGEIVTDIFSNYGCTNSYTETLPASCNYTYASNLDGTHYRVCVSCGSKEATTDCTFANGVCTLCGYSATDYTLLHFKNGSTETSWAWEFANGTGSVSFDSTSNGAMHGTSSDSAGNPYFLIWPQDTCGISHTVAAGDVVEVRLRMNVTSNPGGNTTCIPDVRLQSGTSAYASLTGNATQSISLTTNAWQTVQIPIVGKIYSEGYVINRVLLDPWNALMYLGADIEVDYIYIGQPSTAPSASPNNLYFDFTNNDRAAARYNGDNYEGYNFDVIAWDYSSAKNARPTFNYANEGTLNIGGIIGSSAYAQTAPISDEVPGTPLEYEVASGDIVEMRFKTENLVAGSGSTPSVALYYDISNADSIALSYAFDCTSADILSGEYITVRTSATAGQLISALRPTISGVCDNGTGNGKLVIDYIYIGQESGSPAANADILYFDFTDSEEARARYDSYTYGFYNYDLGGWGINALRNGAPTFDTANGTMSTVVIGESPYLQINAGSSNFSTRPLNFNPAKTEMVQVRLKLENLERIDEFITPTFVFKFVVDDEMQAATNSYLTYTLNDAQLTSGEYFTINLPVGDFFDDVSKVTSIQVSISDVKPISGTTSTVTYDYIYVGPQKDNVHFVYFYNTSGTYCLDVDSSDNGSVPTYKGEVPQVEPEDDYHYEFGGWVDKDGNEIDLNTASFTEDTIVYASFSQVTHEYVYSGDENGHSGICSCGVPTVMSEHNWNNGVITTEATCTTDGVITYSCDTCDYTRNETYAAEGHTYEITVTAPTCTENGYTTHTCDCGSTYNDAYIAAFGHSYSTVVNEATCTQDGYTANTCTTCGDYYISDETAAFGHSYETTTTDPTCTTDGSTVYTCGTCGDIYNEVISAIGHTITYKEKLDATCTETGYTAHYNCSTCGKNYIDAECIYAIPDSYLYTEALGHNVTFYNDKDATCTENGYFAHYKCTNCSTYFVDADCQFSLPEDYVLTAALGHTEVIDAALAPTCTAAGLTEGKHCSVCNEVIVAQEVVPATGHSYTNGTCVCGATESTEPTYEFNKDMVITMSISVGSEMQVIYNIPNSRVKSFESFYLEVVKEVAGGESVTTVFSLANNNLVASTNASGAISRYTATYTGIFAMEMGDNFTATLYGVEADGTINYGTSVSGSIKTCLMEKLTSADSSDELKTLAVDMLNYGAAAQLRFEYDVKNLVNADLTEEQKALGTQEIPTAVDNSSSTTTGGRIITSVSVQSKVLLYLTCIYKSTADSDLKFVIKDADGKIMDEYAPTEINTNNCKVVYDNVSARQMRDLITIELYDNGVLVSRTVTWSIESYVAQTRADSASTEAQINAVNAMLAYGDSTAKYLESTGQ